MRPAGSPPRAIGISIRFVTRESRGLRVERGELGQPVAGGGAWFVRAPELGQRSGELGSQGVQGLASSVEDRVPIAEQDRLGRAREQFANVRLGAGLVGEFGRR